MRSKFSAMYVYQIAVPRNWLLPELVWQNLRRYSESITFIRIDRRVFTMTLEAG